MDDSMRDDHAAIEQRVGPSPGACETLGSSGSASLPGTQKWEQRRDDSPPLEDAGQVDPGGNMDIDLSDDHPAGDHELRAWFDVVAGVGEIVCPNERVVVRDAHAFMNCMMMAGMFAQLGLGVPSLDAHPGEAQGDESSPAVPASNGAGRVVSLTFDLSAGRGTVYHARGRVDFDDPNDLWVQVTYRIIGPAARLARERRSWHLFRDGEPVEQEPHGGWPACHDRPLVGDDGEAMDFLLTQHMVAADDELGEDVEALAFIESHRNFHDVRTASARQVTAVRDASGNLQEVRANDRSRHQVNYSTSNQDDTLGQWAVVQPFSAAGARAALDAFLLPGMWNRRGRVVLEIAPMRSILPGNLTMHSGFVFNPRSAEGLRGAFRLIQALAWDRHTRANPGESPYDDRVSPPAVTIAVTMASGQEG